MSIELNKLRNQIDQIDDQIIQLILDRLEIVKQVGELKRNTNTVIYRPEREKDIIDRLYQKANGQISKAAIEAIFLELFAVSRTLELPEKIAFLGPEGSFTHQVAESRFGAIGSYLPQRTIKGVFDSVSTNRSTFGVIPIENNQAGAVKETISLLAERDCQIVAEISEPIHFCFATTEDDVQDITTIYSKDMAFHQCDNFLRENFNDSVEFVTVESTSQAARLAMKTPNSAALCSLIAAKMEQLPVLFYNVEDSDNNRTRFVIIANQFNNNPSGHDKTSVIAQIDSEPGSLVNLLNAFKYNQINLTKIESWPAKNGTNFSYYFFIDFDGHYLDSNIQEILNQFSNNLKLLGSYIRVV